ncbi:MAG: GIY-YIG nuclease family protein [Chitinophagaceae bacterium]|nr:GIY-YIG nuclease family protein [Chitinophagaceae bacterium]
MFAFVDIETTGGYHTQNCITEIAIILYDGNHIEGKYHTLINPERPIQPYVQSMTGITDKLVSTAPKFQEVAEHIFNLLKNRVFVAHNVNFDYSFVFNHLKAAGFHIDLPKICTVKLSRKIFPDLPKYGLGSLSLQFNIKNKARHRAVGDAEAMLDLFMILQQNDVENEIEKLTKKRKAQQYLPPNLIQNNFHELPSLPGVYYFKNKKGKIIYVGKAMNLKKRVSSHFSNNKSSKQKQEFLKHIYSIEWKHCSSELTASILESIEIKKYWPAFNKSQKHYERQYGIYEFEDARGYKRLAIDNKRKILTPLATYALLVEARNALMQYCETFELHPSMFFLSKEETTEWKTLSAHNNIIQQIKEEFKSNHKTYLVHDNTSNYILVEEGKFIGMGKIENIHPQLSIDDIKTHITAYPENLIIKSYLNNYINKYPENVIYL